MPRIFGPIFCRSPAQKIRYFLRQKTASPSQPGATPARELGYPLRNDRLTASNLATLDPDLAIDTLRRLAARRPDIRKPFLHCAISYETDDRRTPEEMVGHLQQVLIYAGLADHPWVAVIHHPNHIHFLASRVGLVRTKLFNPRNAAEFLELAISKTDRKSRHHRTTPQSIHYRQEPIAAKETAKKIDDISDFQFLATICADKLLKSHSAGEFIGQIHDAGISARISRHNNVARGITFHIRNHGWGGSRLARQLSLPQITQRFNASADDIERSISADESRHPTNAARYHPFATIRLYADEPDERAHECDESINENLPIKLRDVQAFILHPPEYRVTWRLLADGSWLVTTEFGLILVRQSRLTLVTESPEKWPSTRDALGSAIGTANHIATRLGRLPAIPMTNPELLYRLNQSTDQEVLNRRAPRPQASPPTPRAHIGNRAHGNPGDIPHVSTETSAPRSKEEAATPETDSVEPLSNVGNKGHDVSNRTSDDSRARIEYAAPEHGNTSNAAQRNQIDTTGGASGADVVKPQPTSDVGSTRPPGPRPRTPRP